MINNLTLEEALEKLGKGQLSLGNTAQLLEVVENMKRVQRDIDEENFYEEKYQNIKTCLLEVRRCIEETHNGFPYGEFIKKEKILQILDKIKEED